MIYIHGLIAALLLAFFASPVLAAEPIAGCTEYQHSYPTNPSTVTYSNTNGWAPTYRGAAEGVTATTIPQSPSCGSTHTDKIVCRSNTSCRVEPQGWSGPTNYPACDYTPPKVAAGSWGTIFGTVTSRSVEVQPQNADVPIGWHLVDDSGPVTPDEENIVGAIAPIYGATVCREGRRQTLSRVVSVSYSSNCYTVGSSETGSKYCLHYAEFELQPSCHACDGSEAPVWAVPPVPDTDGDGQPDDTDPDVDGDGEPNDTDPDPTGDGGGGDGGGDTDGDGDPDDTDPDDDNDGCPDAEEPCTDPGPDTDGDGNPDSTDPDDDNDGCLDVDEPCTPEQDSDGDGIPDSTDPDDDNDGCLDVNEPCTPGQDSDGDGIPDSTDPDDDNDGCLDVNEPCSGGGGDGDGDGTPGSFGGSCAAGFNCQGDAIQCAIAREIHMNNCKLYGDDDDPGSTFNQAKGGTDGFDPEELRNSAEQVNVGTFNQSGFGWSRACPSDPSIQLAFAGGAEFTIPFSRVCGPLGILSMAGVGITLLGCMVWVLGGRKS